MLKNTEVSAVVQQEIRALLEEDLDDETPELTGVETLSDLGLNSLMLARLLIQLEASVGTDPFIDGDVAISDVRTVSELVDVYQRAVAVPARVES